MQPNYPGDNGYSPYGNQNSGPNPSDQNNQTMGRSERSGGVVELNELDLDLFNRLLKTSVIKASPQIKTIHERKVVILDQINSQRFINGIIFANYLIVLKEVMYKLNQDFAIDQNLVSQMKEQVTPQARLYNWNLLCNELDKIGIIIENDIKSLYVAGDNEEISALFTRIEKYMKRISGDADVLNFKDYRRDDRKKADGTAKNGLSGLDSQPQGRRGLQSNQKKPVKDGVDIMSMDITRDPGDTESTLEFILNTLCRALTMKPKQAAALLTNNNQFLTHCVVKGVKGQYEPMINWYNDIYQNSRHLSNMLETEVENSLATKDQKNMKAAQQNFEKVMQTISTGCYSQNFQVAQLCLKTLIAIGQDLNSSIEMLQLQMRWFLTKENGLYTINYAFKKHQELTEEFVQAIGNFTNGGEQMNQVYMIELNNLYPDMVDYLNCLNQMWPFLQMNYQREILQVHQHPEDYLLSQLIQKGSKYSEPTMSNTPQVRISAISLLTEIWLSHATFIDQQNTHKNQLESIYQRTSRDRMRSVRIVAITQMFKLLDKFSTEKNMSAPTIYKQLIFSLVESPHDQTIRELYLTNFQYLYENMKSIPVGLLVEPLIKANQSSDSFQFQTFDYDFFAFMAQHPKLNATHAIQMLDVLARQYLNDICNASAVSVPFMMICSRYLNAIQCQEFIMKFITISLNQLLQVSNTRPDILDGNKSVSSQKGKPLALPAPHPGSSTDSRLRNPRGSQLRGTNANKDFRISTGKKTSNKQQIVNQMAKSEDEVTKRLKKSLIITMLLKIQNLRQDDVNSAMRDMLLGAQKQYKDQNYGYVHNGIMAVLKYWGDPDLLFSQYLKRQEKIEAEERKAYERLQRMEQVERRMLGYESDDKQSVGRQPGSVAQTKSGLKGSGRNSMALLPIAENQQNLRALHELEMIKKYKKDKALEEEKKFQKELIKQSKKDAKLREEIEMRKIEVGVPAHAKKKHVYDEPNVRAELKALIYKPEELLEPKQIKPRKLTSDTMALVDLNEEEDRDREIINQFMKKYIKIWKYLFSRYANQMYSAKGKKDFDDLGLRQQQINLPEAIKMLKDHNTYPQLIKKNELQQMVRLINIHSKGIDQSTISMLDYGQFLEFIPQLALFCFSKPPIDKSQFPPIESLNALIGIFEQATRSKGKSTLIYEDPDASPFADRELLKALDQKVKDDPSYPIPEGFRKVESKVAVYKYQVPDSVKSIAPEKHVVSTEMLDEILFNVLGIHFLEPMVHFEVQHKVKPAINKTKKPQAQALGYMNKVEKQVDQDKQKGTAFAKMSAKQKRQLDLEIKPKINLALKLQVTKQDLVSRPHYQEVAEVFEEMLQAVENGLTYLPPRAHRRPGQLPNEIKAQREAESLIEQEEAMQAEMRRHERDTRLKKKLKDTNFGGRQMPLDDYRKIKYKVEQEEQEKIYKQERDKFKQKAQKDKEKLDKKKAEQLQELQNKRAEEAKQEEALRVEEEKKRKEWMAEQKKKIKGEFNETYKKRDTVLNKKELQEKNDKNNQQRLKKQMEDYISNTKQEREVEKLERIEIQEFIDTEQVATVFVQYQQQLYHMFKFYAQQDAEKDKLAHDSEWLMNTLSYKEFVRWSYQQEVTPNLVTPEDMVYIYKTLVREQEETLKAKEDPSGERLQSGMLDYDLFKKAICRISIISQEKLGGGNKDLLEKKLNEEGEIRKKQIKEKEKFQDYQTLKGEKDREKYEQLRDYYNREQEWKEQWLSKQSKQQLKQQNENLKNTFSKTRLQKESLKKYNIDQAKVQQEDEFFARWMKQRENLGLTEDDLDYSKFERTRFDRAKLIDKSKPEDKLTEADKTLKQKVIDADLKLRQKKDMTKKELDALENQLKEQKRLKKLKVLQNNVREKMDVNMISPNTIEAFMRYLQLDTDTTERELDRRLTQVNTVGKRTTVVRPPETPKGQKKPSVPRFSQQNQQNQQNP